MLWLTHATGVRQVAQNLTRQTSLGLLKNLTGVMEPNVQLYAIIIGKFVRESRRYTVSEWQPIETAPRDNSMVLLYASDSEGSFWIDTGYWETYSGWYGTPPENPDWISSFDPSFIITHWMELPEPPQ